MALMCVACHTENRDAAKFCKGCGGRLVTLPTRSAAEDAALEDAWGATRHASLVDGPGRATPRVRGASDAASRPSALRHVDAEPTSQPRRIGGGRRQRSVKRHRTVQWLLLAALATVVATGGAYLYRSLDSRPIPAAALPTTPVPTPAAEAAAPASAPEPVAVPVVAPTTPTTPATIAPASAARASPRSTPPRKAAAAPAPPAVVPLVASVPPAPEAEPLPVAAPAPADPGSACAGRNFIATAQCLAAQCGRSEFSAHARCDAVRRQQRIDEEKRNPVNAG